MENYLDTHIQNTGQYQTRINGNVIDETKWAIAYDGDELDLEAKRNDEAVYMKLNKDEILKLFEVPAYHKTIQQRLEDNLMNENDIDIRPIIIEEIEKLIPRTNANRKKKTRRKTNKSRSKHDKKHNNNNNSNSKKHSKSKKHNTSKKHSKSITKERHNTVTPDYLKTIY